MSSRRRHIRTKRASEEGDGDGDGDDSMAATAAGAGPFEHAGPSGTETSGGGGAQARSPREKLEETRLIQRLRKKAPGVDAAKLAAASGGGGAAAAEESEEEPEDDSIKRLMTSYVKATSVRQVDDDEHMEKYVQEELARRLGKRADGDELNEAELARRKVEAELYAVPEHLQPTMNDVNLSGMNAAITEFVLPADDRLRKIEETEAAKRRMLARAGNRAHLPSEDAEVVRPTKMRRGALPATFGKAGPRREGERDDVERLRKHVITDKRPLVDPRARSAR